MWDNSSGISLKMTVDLYLKYLIGRSMLKLAKYLSLMIVEHEHIKWLSHNMYDIISPIF